MNGKLVVVKTIDPDCVDDFNAFKHVCLSLSKTPLIDAILRLGSHRNCALRQSSGSDCDIKMWSGSLG